MIRIVGRKILMQKGELGAFRVLILDSKGKEVLLNEEDKLILRARYKMEADSKFRKVSTPINVSINGEIKLYHIIQFKSTDTKKLLTGDYVYELILEKDGHQSIVIPTSIFTLEDSMSSLFPEDDVTILGNDRDEDDEDTLLIFEDEDDEVIIFEEPDDELEYYYNVVISTPLVGNYNAIAHKKLLDIGDESDDLIIIDEVI